jgi:hypothetical protein
MPRLPEPLPIRVRRVKQMPMLTFSRISGVVLFGLAACLPGSHIGAFEGADGASIEKAPLQTFATPRAALQAGLEGFRSGNATSAIEALKYAAARGELLAQWKLAKIYANGDGVPRDDIKAYDYFSQIVTNYDEDDPNRRDLAVVSSALVALGIYNLNGIADSKVRPDPQRPNVPIRRDDVRRCERPIQFGADAPRQRGRR